MGRRVTRVVGLLGWGIHWHPCFGSGDVFDTEICRWSRVGSSRTVTDPVSVRVLVRFRCDVIL